MNRPFLLVALRVWLTEILVAGVNYYVLMERVYEPAFGELTAHQIGMTTRIVSIGVFAWLLQRYNPEHMRRDLLDAGILWLTLTLIFEWAGSLLLQRRPVDEILIGWQFWEGYMWSYVLLAYLFANLLVSRLLHQAEGRRSARHSGQHHA
jgi:hypothetical protein